MADYLKMQGLTESQCADLVDVQVRLDDHIPIGPHINVESKLRLGGLKTGREKKMTNNHILFDIKK